MAQNIIDNEIDTNDNVQNQINDIPIEEVRESSEPFSIRKYIPLICTAIGILLFI